MVPDWLLPLLPALVFFGASAFYAALDALGLWRAHRVYARARDERVIWPRVLAIQAITTGVSLANHWATGAGDDAGAAESAALGAARFACGMLCLDTVQFWSHYALHSRALFARFHAVHHRLARPRAFAAFYNSYAEGVLLDIASALVTQRVCGLSARLFGGLVALATAKAVCDHSGYVLPWDPLAWFPNNAAYHAVHHAPRTWRFNYQQPFFTFWDRAMGTALSR